MTQVFIFEIFQIIYFDNNEIFFSLLIFFILSSPLIRQPITQPLILDPQRTTVTTLVYNDLVY